MLYMSVFAFYPFFFLHFIDILFGQLNLTLYLRFVKSMHFVDVF